MNERILIVDDDPDALTLIGLTLERRGYTVLRASGGTEALMMVEAERPHLVLLDLMMPHMDGYEVCRRIKSDPHMSSIPIVMLTAKAQMASQVEGYRVGADDYVTKPVHPDDLASHIRTVLERARERSAQRSGGRAVGVIGVKGGVGTTTIAVNLASTFAESRHTAIADFGTGGAVAIHLGLSVLPDADSLSALSAGSIDREHINAAMVTYNNGLRVLPSGMNSLSPDQAGVVLTDLLQQHEVCALDLGGGLSDVARALLPRCDMVVIAIDSDRAAVLQAQRMLMVLTELGVTHSQMRLVWTNRSGLDVQAALHTIRAAMGDEAVHLVDAAIGSAYRSIETGKPLVLSEPDAPAAAALRGLAQSILAAMGEAA